MKTHLTLDIISGIFLAMSPWIFGFKDFVYIPHIIFGILEMGVAFLTDPQPKHFSHRSVDHSHAH